MFFAGSKLTIKVAALNPIKAKVPHFPQDNSLPLLYLQKFRKIIGQVASRYDGGKSCIGCLSPKTPLATS